MTLTPQELPAYLNALVKKLEERGPTEAAYAMSRTFHAKVSDDLLVRSSHPRGTRTGAAAGEPPALVTGGLKRSLRLYPAIKRGAYRAMSKVVPLIIYSRIQELGGIVTAKHTYVDKRGIVRQGYLAWGGKGGGKPTSFAHSVKLPARPFMRPGRKAVIGDGSARRAAAKAVDRIVRGG